MGVTCFIIRASQAKVKGESKDIKDYFQTFFIQYVWTSSKRPKNPPSHPVIVD